jgi:hypothetical protein
MTIPILLFGNNSQWVVGQPPWGLVFLLFFFKKKKQKQKKKQKKRFERK